MNTFYYIFAMTFLFASAVGLAPFSHAEEYNLSYGARLTEANGAPILGQDGKLDLEVSFYNVGTGGSPIGPSPISFPATSIMEGVFQLSITLSSTEFHQVFQAPSAPVYIEVKDVKSGTVFPRQRFSVIPFALKTPIDNDTIVYSSDGKLTVGSSVGTVKQITAGSGLTGGVITDSGTITVDTGTTGNKIVQLSDGKLPSVDGSNLSSVNAEKLQTRNVSAAAPVSGQVLKWSGSAWVPSSDLVGETGSGEANTASSVTSGSGVGLFKEKVSADLMFYSLSPGAGVTISLVGDDVVIASTITQYTDAMAKAAAVADAITDSVTTIAPSQNAVFDALVTKQGSVTTSTDLNLNSITTNAVNAITINPGVSTGEIKLKELSVNGINYVGLKAPGNITSDLTFALPGAAGTNGQVLKTDGSGNLSWTDQASAPVTSVNTLTGAVTLTSTNITEGTNLYYTDARAKTAAVGDAITDTVTDKAPSQNAVFDALALKSEASHNHSGIYEPVGLSAGVVTTTKILNGAVTTDKITDANVTSAKIASGVDAAKIGSGTIDSTEFGYLNGVTGAIQTQLDGRVIGPASATDNAIARFDGTTGKLMQNSSVVIDDSGNVGIGTTSPSTTLDVNGAVKVGSIAVSCDGTQEGKQRYSSTSHSMEFCNGSAWRSMDSALGVAYAVKLENTLSMLAWNTNSQDVAFDDLYVDNFTDQTGVDIGNSTGVYDSGNSLYKSVAATIGNTVDVTTSQIDCSTWSSFNSVTITQTTPGDVPAGGIYHAISFDNKTTWKVYKSSAWTSIARNNSGTWQYSNGGSWTNASSNTQAQALIQATDQAGYQWTKTNVEAMSDANWEENSGWSTSVNTIDWAYRTVTGTTAGSSTTTCVPHMGAYNAPSPIVITSPGSYQDQAFAAWNAFDTDGGSPYYYHAGSGNYFTIDFGASNSKTINKYALDPEWSTTGAWTIYGSNDNSNWTTLHSHAAISGTSLTEYYVFSNTTAYRYYKFTFPTGSWGVNHIYLVEAGQSSATAPTFTKATINYDTEAMALDLRTNGWEASVNNPAAAYCVLDVESVDSITPNTDLKAYVSIDDGSHYEQITLESAPFRKIGTHDYIRGDLSGITARTDKTIRLKLTSHNSKVMKIHGVAQGVKY